jgi:peptidoglycan/LPS O-acetylase OafA/YrhL
MLADNKQMPFLDGLRAYAILLVIFGHIHPRYVLLAQFGVTLFFFVSGFLITKLLIAECQSTGSIGLKKFYIRRFLRLYPALTFMLIITCIVTSSYGFKIVWQEILAGFFYYTNYYRIYFPAMLPAANYPSPGVLWSLAVEEHYYLIFPLLFLAFFSFKNKKFVYLLIGLLILFPALRVFAYITMANTALTERKLYMLTHYRADSILYGCLSALLIYGTNNSFYLKLLRSGFCLVTGIVLLLGSFIMRNAFFRNILTFSSQGIALALIIPCFLFFDKHSFKLRLLNNKTMVFIGKLSYSLYLFHWVARATLDMYHPQKDLQWYCFFLSLTIALSLISFYCIEKPFLRLRKKFGSNVKVT